MLDLTIGLPLRNQAGLEQLLRELYDPASPNYRHFLTPQQFTERFGPTKEDYAAVMAFARANGFTVEAPDPGRVLVTVHAPMAAVEKVFHVRMRSQQHPSEARQFFAPDVEPTLDLDVPIQDIGGLDNFVVPRPAGLFRKPQSPQSAGPSGKAMPQSGSGSGGTYAGNDFRAAYAPGVTLTGAGQSVGVFEFGGYYSNDIVYYENSFEASNQVPIINVLVNGESSVTNNAGAEEALDIEMEIAMAPGMTSLYYYYGSSPDNILSRIAGDNAVHQIGASWLYGTDGSTDGLYQQLAAEGITFFTASGDGDAYPVGSSIDACCTTPYVTCVGGTTLSTTGPGGAWSSEKVWNWGGGTGGSGGISTSYAIPSWQIGISMAANQGSTTMRNIPDVALTADNIDVYYNGSWGSYGGTSCATPLWAGFLALVNEQAANSGLPPVGAFNPAVYGIGKGAGYAAAFHDITTGNNFKTASPTNFSAVAGYDLCTGWGTPQGQATINAFAPPTALQIAPAAGFVSAGWLGGPFSVNAQSFILSNLSATVSFNWSLSSTSAWLTVSATNGILATNGVTNVLISLNPGVVNGLAAGSYSATVAVTSQSVTQTLNFGLFIGSNFAGWTGGSSPNGNWSAVTNWLGNTAPVSGANLLFTGSTQPVNTNDAVATAGWVQLNPGVAFTFCGNPLSLTNGMTNAAQNNFWNIPLVLGANQNMDVASNTTLTVGGAIAGGNRLAKTSAGTLILTATNTYTGATTISAGALEVGGAGMLGNGAYAGNITNNSALIYASTAANTLTGVISGAGSLTQQGAGNLTLAGANTYTGPTMINAGSTLVIGASGSLGSGKNYAGIISGAGGLVCNGTGTQTLSAINTFSGPTIVNAGTLALASGNNSSGTLSAYGSLTINSGGIVQVNTDNSLDGSGSAVGSLPVTINAGGTLTGLSTADSGAGTSSHIWGLLTLAGGTLTDGGTQNQTTWGTWDLNGGVAVNGGTSTSTINCLDVIPCQTGGTLFNVSAGATASGVDLLVSGTLISGSGLADTGIIKTGPGVMRLTGHNTYSGATTINGGTLALIGSAAIASSSAITVAPGALLDVSGLSSTFTLGSSQSLSAGNLGGGATNLNGNLSSAGVINVAGAGTAGTFTINGSLALTGGTLNYDLGAGICDLITLNGAGRTLALSGTIAVSTAGGVFPNGTYTLINGISTISSGGPANLALSATGVIRGNSTAVFTATAPTVTMTVSGGTPAALGWQGSATNGSWDVTTSSNWVNGAAAAEFYNLDSVTFNDSPGTNFVAVTGSVYPGAINFKNGSTVYALAGAGSIAGAACLTNSGAGTVIVSGNNGYSGGTTIRAGTVCLGSTNLGLFVNLGENMASLGTGPVTLMGGTLKFVPGSTGNAFYFTNAITLNGGTLWGEDGEQHFIGPLQVGASGGTLTVKWDSKSLYVDSWLTGSGPLTVNNANNNYSGVHFSNPANTYSGAVTVSGANVTLDNPYALSVAILNVGVANGLQWGGGVTNIVLGGLAGSGSIANGGNALVVGNSNSTNAYSGVLSGTGALTKLGTGSLTLSGANTYSGTTLVSGGTLLVNGSLAAASAVTVAASGTLGGLGTVGGLAVVNGTLAPGTNGVGRLTLSSNLVLAGQAWMAVRKNGSVPTNCVAAVARTLTEGGTLIVTNLGATALAAGDSFRLFNAGSWSGGFTNFSLPALAPGLNWKTNTMATNGILTVAWNTCTLVYAAGSNGTLSGATAQTVNYNTSGTAVTAVPNTGYHFVNWSDGGLANPRTDSGVTNNLAVTANFAINTYTLTYSAATNGTISGTTPQTVYYGASGTAVTAVPNLGYHFVNWSDGNLANVRTDAGVTNDINVTANFAVNTYTLTYSAATNGTITGTSPQTVNYNTSGTAVTAVPNTGYNFVNWSDGNTANPRTDTNVTNSLAVMANFALNTYALTYLAGTNGTLTGATNQTVYYGTNGTLVTAVPNTGYSFTNWSDGLMDNPRTDVNVTSNILVTANFVINTYTLIYLAGTNGTLSGGTPQTVAYGNDGTAVSAVPNPGYSFINWSDGNTANPRADADVTNNLTVTANFVNLAPLVIAGAGMAADEGFTLGGTGGAGQTYILLMASNLPPLMWLPIATNTADSNGLFNFSDAQATNCPQRFYRLTAP